MHCRAHNPKQVDMLLRSSFVAQSPSSRQGSRSGLAAGRNLPPTTPMFVLGLTGSIGMGKSTVARFFAQQGVPVLGADEVVHSLYAEGGAAVGPVGAAFPGSTVAGAVDRTELSKQVVGNEAAMKQLEAIVHPLVATERQRFLADAAAAGHPLVVLDIPLLYESGANGEMDAVVVVSAPEDVQRHRVLGRPGMTQDKFEAILERQVPDSEKRQLADFVIDTSVSLEETKQSVLDLIHQLQERAGGVHPCSAGGAGAAPGASNGIE